MEHVAELFIGENRYRHQLNSGLNLAFGDKQEAARFLLESIRYWHKDEILFCTSHTEDHSDNTLPEEEWWFSYKHPSLCTACQKTHRLCDLIFGSPENFNKLPFVVYRGARVYFFLF